MLVLICILSSQQPSDHYADVLRLCNYDRQRKLHSFFSPNTLIRSHFGAYQAFADISYKRSERLFCTLVRLTLHISPKKIKPRLLLTQITSSHLAELD